LDHHILETTTRSLPFNRRIARPMSTTTHNLGILSLVDDICAHILLKKARQYARSIREERSI